MIKEHFSSGDMNVPVSVFEPDGPGTGTAVVLTYGTRGLNSPFGAALDKFARDLARAGCVALVPDYFKRTRTSAAEDLVGDALVMDAFMHYRDIWIETLGHCVSYARNRTATATDRIALVGFSMGGHLALRLAKAGQTKKPDAVVDFFAPISMQPFNGLGDNIAELPPVQIHHGEDDQLVPPAQSRELTNMLNSSGKAINKDYELFFYRNQGHGFEGEAVDVSTRRTVDFLERHLGVK